MQASASSFRIYTFLAAISATLLSCALLRGVVPADRRSAAPGQAEQSTQTPESLNLNHPIDVEKIEVDYLYRSDLITIIYPLYGSILDDFTIVTITNTNPSLLRIKVLSEVQGYTDQSIDTVTVRGNETLEANMNNITLWRRTGYRNRQGE